MCLAVPMKIIEINDTEGVVELSGVKRNANLILLSGEEIKCGDYVLIHAGFAIQKLDEDDAAERLEYFREMVELQ
jgi:hydrogenase expression/formation protein HypC